MITFTKPANLNGTELVAELKAQNVLVKGFPIDDGNGNLLQVCLQTDEAKAALVVQAHNGTTIAPELTVADKLASVGLSIDDLKSVLGL